MNPEQPNQQPQTVAQPNSAPQTPQPTIIQTPQATIPTTQSKSNDKGVGIVLAIAGFILVNIKSVPVQLFGIVLSVVGTYFIAKSKRANPAWALLGLLPLIGPAIAFFVKPVSAEYGTSPVTGQPNRKSPVTILIWSVAAFIILGSIFFFVIVPMMIKHN